MYKKIRNIISIVFVVAIVMSYAVIANAADNELTINGEVKAKVGDIVKFDLTMSDCTQKILGIDTTVVYDKKFLSLDKKSLSYEKFDAVIQNPNLDGYFKFNWTQVNNSQDFSKKAIVVSAKFKVLKAGKCDISHFITDMYDDDMKSIDPYKITYDFSINNKVVAQDVKPTINTDLSNTKKLQGGFTNYLDGMGDSNTPNKSDHQSFIAERRFITKEVQTDINEVTKTVSDGSGSNIFSGSTIFIIIGIVVFALIIGAIVFVAKKGDGKIAAVSKENSDANLQTPVDEELTVALDNEPNDNSDGNVSDTHLD